MNTLNDLGVFPWMHCASIAVWEGDAQTFQISTDTETIDCAPKLKTCRIQYSKLEH